MFHPVLQQKRIVFHSNPPVSEKPQIIPGKDSRGNFTNELKMVSSSNKPDHVVHYVASEMSLRALINRGVKMSEVYIGQIENDPTALQRNAIALEKSVEARLNELQNDAAPFEDVLNEKSE